MKKIAVTNRHLCMTDKQQFYKDTDLLLKKLETLVKEDYSYFILREKDLDEDAYFDLAQKALDICGDKLILHTYYAVAIQLSCPNIHLPYDLFCSLDSQILSQFQRIGVSIHSPEEARIVEQRGATYVTAGHVFDTDCKKGLPGRGLDWLTSVTSSVSIAVYAIGGITEQNKDLCMEHGACGICVMSAAMH